MKQGQIELLLKNNELDLLIVLLQQKHAEIFLSEPAKLPQVAALLAKLTITRQNGAKNA